MTVGQDDPAAGASRGRLRASHADRDQVIDAVNAAFADGRLSQDEREARVSQALAALTCADLAVLTADIPVHPAPPQPPAAHPPAAHPPAAHPPAARPPAGPKAVKRTCVAVGGILPLVFFFEAVVRGNADLVEACFLLLLVDLIVLTVAASNPLLPPRSRPGWPGSTAGRGRRPR